MAMRYDVMDTETGNLYGRFQTEEAALALVRGLIDANGAEITETVAVGGRNDDGRVLPVATGEALARRVSANETKRKPLARRA
ncbi:MAG: hypothetical protein ACRDJH_15210 [Thermomicrobiales bacterium]